MRRRGGARPESRSSHAILYPLARNRPRLGIDRKHRIDAFRRGRSIARQRISDDCGNFKKSDCPREQGGHRDLVAGIEDRRLRVVRLERFSCPSARGKTFAVRRFEVASSEERRVGKECVSTWRSRWWPYQNQEKIAYITTSKT